MQVYVDNAATSQAKPPSVLQAIEYYFKEINSNPGRGGYELSLEAGRKVLEARETLARFFNVPNPNQIIFTSNITEALNTAIQGLLQPNDHVLITGLEHNAVVRPLKFLEKIGVSYSIIPTSREGLIEPSSVEKVLQPNTKMIVATHASNVAGTIVPLKEIGEIAAAHGLYFVIDTAQTAGCLPLDFQNLKASVLAFTGHKHLLGPMGIGGFCVREDVAEIMRPLYVGGTGSISDQDVQPDFLPDKFESGTLNTLGIVGLAAAVEYISKVGLDKIREREIILTKYLLEGLLELPEITVYGPRNPQLQTGTIALNAAQMDNAELCYVLDQQFKIMTRPGLHCAPLAHKTLGTFPEGALRISIGHYTTEQEIAYVLDSLKKILARSC
ncbi:aminotransferase class V-fold PLP-dependent enzyme [Bacillota bacterium LX-D]|nr:aminotransferase class V-fold PLP-dependent enzyme [Bacillota bacterium LX-D]